MLQQEKKDKKKSEIRIVEIPELNIEVEAEYRFENVSIKNMKIPLGWRLLTLNEFLICYNKYKDKFIDLSCKTEEIVLQPIIDTRKEYHFWKVFFKLAGYLPQLCGESIYYGTKVKGIRFCRTIYKENKVRQ